MILLMKCWGHTLYSFPLISLSLSNFCICTLGWLPGWRCEDLTLGRWIHLLPLPDLEVIMRSRIKSRQSVGPWRGLRHLFPLCHSSSTGLLKYTGSFFTPFFADLPYNYTLISDSEEKRWIVEEEARKQRWKRRFRKWGI